MGKKEALEYIDSKAELVTEVSDKIWGYAELSLMEHQSSELYVEVLKKEGFQVETPVCGIETAYIASYGSGKPIIRIQGGTSQLRSSSRMGSKACKLVFCLDTGIAGSACHLVGCARMPGQGCV